MATSYTYKPIVTNGLVFSVDAANIKSYPGSGTTWTDLTSNANNGTLTNGPTFNSANGGSIVFDGADDYISISDSSSISITGDITIDCWVKVNNFSTYRCIVAKTNGGYPAPFDLYLDPGTGNPFFLRGNGGYFYYFSGGQSPTVGIWQNLTITMAGSFCRYYLNGNFINGSEITNTFGGPIYISDNDGPMFIGRRADGATIMDGSFSNLRIYNRELSGSEVLQNFNSLKSRFGL